MQWQTPEKPPVLEKNQVHIWRTSLNRNEEEIAKFLLLLDEQEKQRAAKYMVKKAADGFIISRAVLRMLLAEYLNQHGQGWKMAAGKILGSSPRMTSEEELSSSGLTRESNMQNANVKCENDENSIEKKASTINFQQNKYGKLFLESSLLQLDDQMGQTRKTGSDPFFQFNLSHSNDLALFIFALDAQVGIDVEFVKDNYSFADIAKRFFSKSESAELFALPKDQQLQAFFNCWSRKEAFIKALGTGLYSAFDGFSVKVSAEKTGAIDLLHSEESDKNNWKLEAFDPGDRYSGAFAVGMSDYKVELYDF